MGHTNYITVFVLFILVCSSLCRDDTLSAEGVKEQVLAVMVFAVVVRRSVRFSVNPPSLVTLPRLSDSILEPPFHTVGAQSGTRQRRVSLTPLLTRCTSFDVWALALPVSMTCAPTFQVRQNRVVSYVLLHVRHCVRSSGDHVEVRSHFESTLRKPLITCLGYTPSQGTIDGLPSTFLS